MPRKDPPRLSDVSRPSKGTGGYRINPFGEDGNSRIARARRKNAQARNKIRSDIPGTASLTREPKLTPEYAAQFVRLTHAGIPPDFALSYFAPLHYDSLKVQSRREWLSRWQRNPLMAQATVDFNKAAWQDLDKDARLQLALDKHMAELAFFLYTTEYATAEGTAHKKISEARDALMQFTKDGEGDQDTPFMRAMKDLIAGKMDGAKSDGGRPRFNETIPTEAIPKH